MLKTHLPIFDGASDTCFHFWSRALLAHPLLGMRPSFVRKFMLAFPPKAFDALQYVDAILAYAALASTTENVACESIFAFPEMTVCAFVWRACIFLFPQATSATAEIVFAGPLRGKETVLENHEIAQDASF